MIQFDQEIQRLFKESPPLDISRESDTFTSLAETLEKQLAKLNKRGTEIAIQVEELYETSQTSNLNELLDSLREEKDRERSLALTVIGLCDLLEHFREYAAQSESEALFAQAETLWKQSERLLQASGMARIGELGEPVDETLHIVAGTAKNDGIPRELVAQVLQRGYRYLGEVIRRATILMSMGGDENGEMGRN